MKNYFERIGDLYRDEAVDAKELFQYIMSAADAITLDNGFSHLERCVIEKRLSWFQENAGVVKTVKNPLERAYRLFYEQYLGLTVPHDGTIVERTETTLVMRWWNHCPTLEACNTCGLDTRDICRKVYHRPVQEFVSRIHPKLHFERNYDHVRPHVDYCEEMFYLRA